MPWLAGCRPFHDAIELCFDIVESRVLQFVRSSPVHQWLRCAWLHIVVDSGAADRQPHAHNQPEDKSHCPYSRWWLVMTFTGTALPICRCKSVTCRKLRPRNHTRLDVAGTCPVQR